MIKGSVNSIETFGLVDGPGIRTVIFLNGCKLRCKFCHNPETWTLSENNYSSDDIVERVLRNKPYFGKKGGVTFSGGEPLLHNDFLIDVCKKLKKENVHIALDTAGIGNGYYEDILKYVDLVLLDVKGITEECFLDITQQDLFGEYLKFIKALNESCKPVWIRQVIIPTVNDSFDYIRMLGKFLKDNINNIKRIDLLPYHKMGEEKYDRLGIRCPYHNLPAMDTEKCKMLNDEINNIYFN